MTEIDTLVTPEMEQQKGVWGPETVSYPVSESDIRKWAIAVYWPMPPQRVLFAYSGSQYSRGGGIVAPMDFNPFAWPIPTGDFKPAGAVPGQTPKKGQNILNGGQADTYGVRVRPGDVVTSRSRLSHWEERQGRNGLTLFAYNETEWRNQHGELVKTRISTGIRY